MARPGRPPKLTSQIKDAIVKALAVGVPRRHAALAAEVTERTLYSWLARGRREARGEYFRFHQAVKKAEAQAVAVRVARIARAAVKGNWQADAWWLERRHPESFALNRSEVKALTAQVADLTRRLDEVTRAAGATETKDPPAGAGADASRNGAEQRTAPGVDPVPRPPDGGDGEPG